MTQRLLTLFLWLPLLQADAGDESPPGPLSPAESMQKIQLAEGYAIELVAAEPHVLDPVAFAWDANGRLFVAEMGDYPQNPGGGRIKELLDQDGDGLVDSHRLFADGIPFPNGLLPYRDGLLVTAAPDILHLRDTDGDGKADQREVILTGFQAANQQLRVNGMQYGFDGWVYAANGRNGGQVTSPKRPNAPPVSVDRHDLRFRPDTGEVEPAAGFSQFGNAFDSMGERFINWNTVPIRHAVFPFDVARRHSAYMLGTDCEVLEDPLVQNRVFPISDRPAVFNREPAGYFNASCGLSIEKGGIFPTSDAGSVFVCEPLFNMIHRRVLEHRGGTFVARRPASEQDREFLASRDPWFRPVFTQSGPSGALYVADFYRQWVEHPDFVRPELRVGVAWETGNTFGRLYRIQPTSAKRRVVEPLASMPAEALVARLGDSNAWSRETARRLLRERDERRVIPDLRTMLSKDPSPLARLGALSLLADWQEPAETLARALDDADPALRRWSLRLLRARTDAPAAIAALGEARLQTLATDADARVRLELALAVDHLPIDAKSPGRARILWDLLSTAPFDPWVTQGVYVVADQSAWDLLGYCLDAASPPRSDIPSTLARLAGRLDANPSHSPIHHLGRGLRLNDSTGLSRGILAGWLTGLAESGKSLPTEVAGQPLTEWMKEARAMVAAENPRPDDLDAGLRLLAFDPSPQSAELLLQRLSGADSLDVTRLCLNGLRSRAGQEVADGILSAWTAASPTVKREMLSILLGRPGGVSKLLTAIDEGQVRATDIDPDSKARLLERATADEKPRAAKLLGEAASADRSGVIQQILTAIPAAGDQSEGKEIFAKHCAGCHRSGDLGHRVGPDLAGMASKSREQLLEDILDPNRQILGDYAAVSVVTTDGVSLTGLLAGESSATITLRRAEGIVEEVPRAKVEEFRGTGKSLMPEGFEQSIAPQQFAHLLAFLRNRP